MIIKILCISLLATMGICIICLIAKILELKAINKILADENEKIYEQYNLTRGTYHDTVQMFCQMCELKAEEYKPDDWDSLANAERDH